MENEENLQGITQENTTTEVEQQEQVVENNVQNENPVEPKKEVQSKTFTQEQVNKIMRSRLDRDRLSFFNRYGVKDRDGLDGLIGKAQSYDVMKERYNGLKNENAQLRERLAFVSNGINPDREDDIRAYFKGKGIEFSDEALIQELETHPEWRKVVDTGDSTPKTTIKALGVEHRDRNVQETEAEKRRRIFGI